MALLFGTCVVVETVVAAAAATSVAAGATAPAVAVEVGSQLPPHGGFNEGFHLLQPLLLPLPHPPLAHGLRVGHRRLVGRPQERVDRLSTLTSAASVRRRR